jgi:oligopeptide/dipeptide ABC transporter ATP-binding protein
MGGMMSAVDVAPRPLVRMDAVTKYYPVRSGLFQRRIGLIRAVDGVDLTIASGTCLGLVGESGSGKSTLGRLLVRLIEPTSGTITFGATDVTRLSGGGLRRLRRNMQIVFQDPYSSMDPRSYVSDAVAEPLRSQLGMKGGELDDRVAELFRLVGLSPSYRNRFPRELSGGQLQRLAVARALATNPQLVICDEPVSSLDVSTRAEIINLLSDLQDQLGIAYLFIAHDLSVVRHISDRIAVMYRGRIVEEGDAASVYESPQHPYTQALLSAVPVPDPIVQRARKPIVLQGEVPSHAQPVSGCRFHTRCIHVMDACMTIDPPETVTAIGTRVSCHLYPSQQDVQLSRPNGRATYCAGP